MRDTLRREVAEAGLTAPAWTDAPVTEDDLAGLPEPARRYLHFMRVVGRPRDASVRIRMHGRFRPSLHAAWKTLDSRQYNTGPPETARVFHMRLPFLGVPVQGRDTYLEGHGRMLIRPLDAFTVQDARGEAFDLGELVTWLNDAVMFAPSMLLHPSVTFHGAGEDAFRLVMVDHLHTVSARVEVDGRGAVTGFVTDDRAYAPPGARDPVRTRWSTPVEGWQACGDRMIPTAARAEWLLEGGPFSYAEAVISPDGVAWNVPPDAA